MPFFATAAEKAAAKKQRELDRLNARMLICAGKGDVQETSQLIEQGADPNYMDKFGYTPLIHAAKDGFTATVQLLLDRGAEVNTQSKDDGSTAFVAAACGGVPAAVPTLLAAGANPFLPLRDGSNGVTLSAIVGAVSVGEKDIGGSRGSLEAPGSLLMHLHLAYSDSLPCTCLNPLAERTCFSQVSVLRELRSRGADLSGLTDLPDLPPLVLEFLAEAPVQEMAEVAEPNTENIAEQNILLQPEEPAQMATAAAVDSRFEGTVVGGLLRAVGDVESADLVRLTDKQIGLLLSRLQAQVERVGAAHADREAAAAKACETELEDARATAAALAAAGGPAVALSTAQS